ncbi:MAG: uroporphyrinogen-III C-methyltransferase [Acutalibacteraceae bacterium]
MKQGKVWLVGAGPGDTGLLTLKGKEVLEQADVVLYDKLVGTGILNMIPDSAQKMNVGKCAGNHTMPQSEINLLLLNEAQKGNHVVRLKGGDPFLFGRGGEELELLAKHHIPFEVVPGVTSAVSVPAYAGIPVTHRNYASSVHIITGHKKADENNFLDFTILSQLEGTLVFLMGLSALDNICSGLVQAGKSSDTPAAILEQGTTAHQRRVVADLKHYLKKQSKQIFKHPPLL